jgi:hypothetical protein
MNNALEEIRARVGQSIEQIMMDQIKDYKDGQGWCTRVDCLLEASVEAARIFVMEK